MDEVLPEEELEAAEQRPSSHDHGDTGAADIEDHLEERHGLDAPDHLSDSTLHGVHDRLHRETDAIDDPDEH